MWIEGYDDVYPESRKWLRAVPRAGKRVGIWFGENVRGEGSADEDAENVFEGLRGRWRGLVERDRVRRRERERDGGLVKGKEGLVGEEELSEELMYGREAVELRKECTLEVRKAVLDVRRKRGLDDEDPKHGLVETWREEGSGSGGEGRMEDGSWVKDT